MRDIMDYSSICKKFEGAMEQSLQQQVKDLAAQINKVENPNFSYHCKAIKEILGATFWVFTVKFSSILADAGISPQRRNRSCRF